LRFRPSCSPFVRLGAKLNMQSEVMDLLSVLGATGEEVSGMVQQCSKDHALAMVDRLVAFAKDHKLTLQYEAHDAMLKVMTRTNDARAFAVLNEIQAQFSVTEATAMGVMALCASSQNVALAEAVLEASPRTVIVYSALMRVYASARVFHKTCALYDTLKRDGVEPDNVMYGCLIKAAVESGRLDLARAFVGKSSCLDIQNYMSLFRACAREKDATRVLDLLHELEASQVQEDTTAYNCVLDVCFKCRDKRAAKGLFAKMKATGYVDVISFNTMVKGLGSSLDGDSVVEEMRTLGLAPNQITYNTLINAAVTSGAMSSAWKYLSVMKLEGIAVDRFTIATMMKGLRSSGPMSKADVDNMLQLFESDAVIDEVLVNMLVDTCVRLRDIERLKMVLQTFRRSGVALSESAYATVLKSYGHAHAAEEVAAVWTEMLAQKVCPKEATVVTLVETLGQSSVDAVVDALRELRSACPQANAAQGYAALAKILAQRKDAEKAVELLSEAKEAGVLKVAVFYALITACASAGKTKLAAEMFKDMCASSVAPTLATFSAVIKGYCVTGEMELALQLFAQMRSRKVEPDTDLFNALLSGCARKKMTALVEMILSDLLGCVKPTSATLAILVRFYGSDDVDQALEVVRTWPAQYTVVVSDAAHTSLLTACVAAGRITEAQEILQKIPNPPAMSTPCACKGAFARRRLARQSGQPSWLWCGALPWTRVWRKRSRVSS